MTRPKRQTERQLRDKAKLAVYLFPFTVQSQDLLTKLSFDDVDNAKILFCSVQQDVTNFPNFFAFSFVKLVNACISGSGPQFYTQYKHCKLSSLTNRHT